VGTVETNDVLLISHLAACLPFTETFAPANSGVSLCFACVLCLLAPICSSQSTFDEEQGVPSKEKAGHVP
jgi:hypothetical protein